MDHTHLFTDELTRQGKSKSTIRNYMSDLNSFSVWFKEANNETPELSKITSIDCRDYVSYLRNIKHLKPTSINRRIISLKRYLEWALAEGLISRNPAETLKTVTTPLDAPKALERSEARRLLREVERGNNLRDICVIQLLLDTGIRVSELCNIRLVDIDISERKGILNIPLTKGGKSRSVPLSKNCRDAIQKYLEIRPLTQHDYLVCGQRGKMTPSGIFRLLQSYGDRAGIKISPHMLRHTLATKLLREDKQDIVLVQRLLGHTNLNTTARYTKPSEKDLIAAVEELFY